MDHVSLLRSKSRLQTLNPRTARALYLLLTGLLAALFVLGIAPRSRILMLNGLGLNGEADAQGRIRLFAAAGLPAAAAGVREGDTLLSVNGTMMRTVVLTEVLRRVPAPVDGRYLLEVRGLDGGLRRANLAPGDPVPALFGLTPLAWANIQIVLDLLLALGFVLPALIIFWRRPNDRLSAFVAVTLLFTGFRLTSTALFAPFLPATLLVFGAQAISRVLLLIFLFTFPTGEYFPQWTRRFVLIAGVWAVLSLFLPAFYTLSGQLLDTCIFAVGLWAQIRRYRRVSNVQEQQQTKWIVFGLTIAYVVGYLLSMLSFHPALRESASLQLRFLLANQVLFTAAALAIPITVLISIFRYRLYEIDVIINRALVYGALTAILSGLSVAMIGFFQRLTLALTGESTEAAIVITTLIVASLVTPLKTYLQTVVDRHFKDRHASGMRLAAFVEELNGRLFALDPQRIAARLLEEAVLGFGAAGGVIKLDGSPQLATRAWNGSPEISVLLRVSGGEIGSLALGPRLNGAQYTEQDRRLIQTAADETSRAIEQDRAFFTGSREGGQALPDPGLPVD